jgi:hypothetical protein
MMENKNDLRRQQSGNNSNQQSTWNSPPSLPDKPNIEAEDAEEWKVITTDQRRPQFRFTENNRRRIF